MYRMYKKQKFLWVRYCMVIVLLVTVFFSFVSLVTYDPLDASWFYISTESVPVSNMCGQSGAQCAALLMYLFGGAAFLFIIPLIMLAYSIGCGVPWRDEWERVVAAFCFGMSCAALFVVNGIDFFSNSCSGGIVGIMYARWLLYWWDPLGRMVFLPLSMTAFMVVLLRFSPVIYVQRSVVYMQHFLAMIRHYRVVYYSAHAVYTGVYYGCVYPFIFLFNFIQSLLNGSAFDDTDLIVPAWQEERSILQHVQDEVYPEQCRSERSESVYPPLMQSELLESVQTARTEHSEELACAVKVEDNSIVQNNEYKSAAYTLPHMNIFIYDKDTDKNGDVKDELQERAYILCEKLKRFGVSGEIVAIKQGPVVTLFEYQPDADTKLSKIIALEDDLAMALQAMSIRILAPIPGRAVVGFEVANAKRNDVLFSQLISTPVYKQFSGALPLILGKGTVGEIVVVDLARMPHLLIAGSTGSGKSVALNALLISLLCELDPDELKLILIDPKRLEFSAFADIAHLLFPIVTSPHHAAPVLKWVVNEMERRYEKMATMGARNSADYNALVVKNGEGERLPSIVVIIDELADLMLTAGRDIEDLITRITQMARAAGIHMIVATQRPSVDVITGLIKANFPSRISFRVASRIDSRTILDTMGADKLLGRGDMLFLDAATSQLRRVHGAYVSDKEIELVVNHIRSQRKVVYLDIQHELHTHGQNHDIAQDPLYEEIRLFLDEVDEISISLVQRRFRIGYNRSARIIDVLELDGLIMPQGSGKMRKVIR